MTQVKFFASVSDALVGNEIIISGRQTMNLPTKEELIEVADELVDEHYGESAVVLLLRAIADGRLVVCRSSNLTGARMPVHIPATSIPDAGGQTDE